MWHYNYLIIGGGMTADAAIDGIRQVDPEGAIGLISTEVEPPYDRPPLTKGLWKGKPFEKIWRGTPAKEGVTLYLDASDHLPVKKTYSWRDATDKQRNVEEEVYDNYRSVQGVMTPFTVTRYYNGDMSGQRFLTSVNYNLGISDSQFEAAPGPPQKR